uniref:LRRNT domain-containing protein n=1 Tax=Ciona intestinalis TaxID=7719 RepID=H2XJT9_CIOIN
MRLCVRGSMLKLSKAYTCLGGCNCSTDVVTSGIEVYCRGKNMHRIPAEALAREAWGSVVIDFGLNELSALPANAFRGQTKLKRLILDHNDIEKVDPACFNKLPKLLYLDISINKITKLPRRVFSRLANLKVLDLSQNSLDSVSAATFDGLRNLEALFLQNNPTLNYIPATTFTNLPRLKYLFLYGCGLRSVSIPDTGLNVKYIWLFGNPLNCNCRLVSLAMYLQTSKVILDSGLEKLEVDTGNPRGDAAVRVKLNSIRVKIMPTICVSPTNRHRSVVGIPVAKIPVGSLTCPDEPVYIIVSVFLGIICFALSVPVVFCLVGAYLLVLKLGKTKFG